MSDHSEAFVAFDTAKLRNAVAIADGGRGDEVRFLGEFDNTPAATAKLVRKLAAKYERLTFCYEAGPTGYGLYRQIKSLGHECIVGAPSLIPKKAGDRVKTNRRDAIRLAKLLRSGDLSAVWVPDPQHEAMRELTRARETAMNDLRAKRQQISAFLLRRGVHYPPDKKTWGKMHINWLMSQKFEFTEERIVFGGADGGDAPGARAARSAGGGDPRGGAGLVALQAGYCTDGDARPRFHFGLDHRGRGRRPLALSNAARADGLCRDRAVGGLYRRQSQAWSDHQDRQSAGATHASRVCLELSVSAAVKQRQTGQGRGGAASGSRDCLEGAVPPQSALPSAAQEGQAQEHSHYGGGS